VDHYVLYVLGAERNFRHGQAPGNDNGRPNRGYNHQEEKEEGEGDDRYSRVERSDCEHRSRDYDYKV
jgi:hypothetical protein